MPYPFVKPGNLDEPIWRYQSFAKFVAMLEHGGLYFARAIDLAREDPFEGRLSDVGMCLDGKPLPKDLREMSRFMHILRVRAQLSCWHLGAHESVAMWRVYGKHEGAVALRSTFRALSDALKDEANVGLVQYLDYSTQPIEIGQGLITALLSKRMEFSHEREVRAVAHMKEGVLPTAERVLDAMRAGTVAELEQRHAIESGRYVAVDLKSLIKGVVVTPEAGAWLEGLVREVLGRYGLGEIPVRASTVMRAPPPSP